TLARGAPTAWGRTLPRSSPWLCRKLSPRDPARHGRGWTRGTVAGGSAGVNGSSGARRRADMMRRRGRLRLAFVLAGTICIAGCDSEPVEGRRAVTVVRLTSGTPGAGFHPLGEGLARAFARQVPDIALEVHESPGAVRNVEALQAGTADIGFAFADVAYLAYVGRLPGRPEPFDRLRGIAVLQ